MIATTVVGWDGTEAAQAALEWSLARWADGKVTLVRAADADVSTVETFAANSPAASARVTLMDEAERIRNEHPGLTVGSEFVAGDPAVELARYSRPDSLVVVGTDRRRGGGIRYGWSVGAKLAAAARGPVAIVPEGYDRAGHGITVGIDGSPASDAAVEFAAAEADRTGQSLRAVHAWQEPPVWLDAPIPDAEYLSAIEEMHSQILDGSLLALPERHPDLRVDRSLVHGPAYRALLDAAEDAALLVVGNHGLRGLKRFLLGSVSHSVIVDAVCPIVVVRSE